jgi:hypothetical protein
MSLNPWLITWEIENKSNRVPDCLIAAILPNETPCTEVAKLMQFIYYCIGGTIYEKLGFARKRLGYKAFNYAPKEELHLGESPWLRARHVFNLTVTGNEEEEVVTWDEYDPRLGDDPTKPVKGFKHTRFTYDSSTNEIKHQIVNSEATAVPPKRRKRSAPRSKK